MLKNIWEWFLWFTGVTDAGCHRIGLHRTADGLYVLCRKHHPDVPNNLTLEHIQKSHVNAKAKKDK